MELREDCMQAYVALTDNEWFKILSGLSDLDEVNFWQPSGSRQFMALAPGELFLFKLHHPLNYIVGGGVFAHFSLLPVSLAWEAFDVRNGALSLSDMRTRLAKYRRSQDDANVDYTIGCIILEQPFFLERDRWIPTPDDWSPNVVQGKRYDLSKDTGLTLWRQLRAVLELSPKEREDFQRYGSPITAFPRLGQGSFRVLVTDAYKRRCAITRERTLPALDAAHIRPFSKEGTHVVSNGLLLRRDIHALFDKGYLTVTPKMKVEVSRRIKVEFENGKDYYVLERQEILLPDSESERPSREFLDWHNTNVFRG